MTDNEKKMLRQTATKVRIGIIEATHAAGSGHPGGSLSIADLLTYLYFKEMNIDPADPKNPDRDRLVLSKGHAAPALYSVLANRGYFPVSDLLTLRKHDSYLQGHPDMKHIPGVDMSSGSLGQGISAACGMAVAAGLDGKKYRVFAILGDGECEEGQVWEAAMFASAKKLGNLIAFVDWNGLQIDGSVEEVNSPLPLDKKFEAFNWNVAVIDGHDFDALESVISSIDPASGIPTAVIMKTVKGKGVSFMENSVGWHGTAPNNEQAKEALGELRNELDRI